MVAALLGLAATTWMIVWWLWTRSMPDWKGLLGGTSFLAIPLLVGFGLFVGLRTGLMPQRGRRVSRADHPVDFWFTGGLYATLLAMCVGFILMVAFDAWRSGS